MTPSVLELGTHSPIWYQEASMLKRTLNFIATDPRSSSLEETAHEYVMESLFPRQSGHSELFLPVLGYDHYINLNSMPTVPLTNVSLHQTKGENAKMMRIY